MSVYSETSPVDGVSFDRDSYTTRQGDSFFMEAQLNAATPGPRMYSFWFDYGDGVFVERENPTVVFPDDYSNAPGDRTISVKAVNLATKTVVAAGSVPFTVVRATPSFYVEAESAQGVADGSSESSLKRIGDEFAIPVPTAVSRWVFDWGDGTTTELDRLGLTACVAHCYASSHKSRTVSLSVVLDDGKGISVSFDVRTLRQ